MNLKKFGAFILFLVGGCSIAQKQESPPIEKRTEEASFFVPIPIAKFSSIQSPCVNVDIEGKIFSMELDLGYRGDLVSTKEWIDPVLSKIFVCEKQMYGIRGKSYPT